MDYAAYQNDVEVKHLIVAAGRCNNPSECHSCFEGVESDTLGPENGLSTDSDTLRLSDPDQCVYI